MKQFLVNLSAAIILLLLSEKAVGQSDELSENLIRKWTDLHESLVNADLQFVLYRAVGLDIPVKDLEEIRVLCSQVAFAENVLEIENVMEEYWLPAVLASRPDFVKTSAVWGVLPLKDLEFPDLG